MTVSLRLPRLLGDEVTTSLTHELAGSTVAEVFETLFAGEPALRHHLLDETGAIRRHVSVFVDGSQAGLDTQVPEGASMRVIQAVSGG